ncbi:DUF4362 domain-containing protein [Evansella sp. AB-rgal1]|uniref:DUF4362 domain-containing protein n=1 Tax=Evansella sp. AB-rgal1 TaxID=3242696 RepID=UPI00359CDE35
MKRLSCFILIFVFLIGCNSEVVTNSSSRSNDSPSEIYVEGLKNVDVLNVHGSVEGLDRMMSFYDDVKNGVNSDLRVVHYTIEGDPLVTDLHYKEGTLEVTNDYSRDKFGSGEIISDTCGKLVEEVNPTNTTYIAVECAGGFDGMHQILQIEYNMHHQDRLELELRYGVNLENEINTVTNTLEKEISENEIVIETDFRLVPTVKQEVYRKLVFANYLADKEFSNSCGTEETIQYYLKVHINSGSREFDWSACDQSVDGEKFTDIATHLIEQSKNNQDIQQEVTIQGYVLESADNEMLIGEGLTMLDYQWVKEELRHIDFTNYIFDFIILTGWNGEEFHPGDKVYVSVEEYLSGFQPRRAKVKEIKKLELY